MSRVTTPLIRYSHLGLVRLSIFAHPDEAHKERAFRSLQSLNYWTYWAHCDQPESGFYLTYATPHQHLKEFRDHVLGLADFAKLDVVLTGDPFSLNSPHADVAGLFQDPKSYTCDADESDLKILEQLEESPGRTSGEIAARTGLLQADVRSHLNNCIQPRGLMVPRRSYHEHGEGEELWVLRASFSGQEGMAEFVNHLRKSRLTHTAVKALAANELVVHFYLDDDGSEEHRRHLSHQPALSKIEWWRIDLSEYGKTYGAWTIRSHLFDGSVWASPLAVRHPVAASV